MWLFGIGSYEFEQCLFSSAIVNSSIAVVRDVSSNHKNDNKIRKKQNYSLNSSFTSEASEMRIEIRTKNKMKRKTVFKKNQKNQKK